MSQTNIVPWLRRLIITLGPLEEYKGAKSGDVIRLESDGTQNTLRVLCNIQKTVMGFPNPSTITIYNLSRETRSAIQRGLTKITIEAGWDNTELHKVFQGSVMSSISQKNGSDILTKLTCLQGYGAAIKSVASITYASGTSVKTAIKDLASKLPGISVSEANLKEVTGTFGRGGWSFAGSTKDALTELANEYGFSWTIEDGAIRAIGDKAKFEGVVVLDGTEGGLILIVPTLQGPMQIQMGVKIKALYVPGVAPGATVRVRSSIDKSLDGDYRIHTASITLDTFADSWLMDLESFKYRV